MEPMHYRSLAETAAAIRTGACSAAEVTETILVRIAELEPRLHGYARVMAEQARRRAELLDRERAAGRPVGPLHGIPIAVKDLLWTRGVVTASGTRVMADHVPDSDATVVARLEAAGAIVIGKSQLTEGAFGSHHPDIVPPVNPWGPDLWTGVSSSGSGVVVSAGLAFGALGTDSGGSIRFPSACCGLVGIKPTYGRVSRHGAFPLGDSLDHVGPMTRTVTDAALMLQVIAGHDPQDPTSLMAPVPEYLPVRDPGIEGIRIGVDRDYIGEGVEAPVVAVVEEALEIYRELGATIVDITMPEGLDELVSGWNLTCGVECARAHAPFYPARRDEYGPALAALIEYGLRADPSAYAALEQVRGRFRSGLDGLYGQCDLIIAPCMPMLPPTLAQLERISRGQWQGADLLTYTAPFDYSGHPTITLPAEPAAEGVPRAFQLIGRHLDEKLLIRMGAAHERALGLVCHPLL